MLKKAAEPFRTLLQLKTCAAQAATELKRLTNRTIGISAVASQARLNRQLMVELLYKAAGERPPVLPAGPTAAASPLYSQTGSH